MPKIEPFEKHTQQYEDWFENNKYAYQSEINAMKLLMPDFKNGVEIGVGSGKFASPFGIKFGVEPSSKMADISRRRGIKVIEGVCENLPLKNESFDMVLMVTTLCFLDDAIVSVYPEHIERHELKQKIEDSSFAMEKEFLKSLIHDNKIKKGYILNFRKVLK